MSDLILHIGMHKTGTTAIQEFLASNAADLLKGGVLYPRAGRGPGPVPHIDHHELAWSSVCRYATRKHWPLTNRFWEEITKEIQETAPSKSIVSSEFFWPASSEEIANIREQLKRMDVTVVIYVRNALSLAKSSYKQVVKSEGWVQDFSSYLRECLWLFDFGAVVQRWVGVFGKRAVVVRVYDKVKKELVPDFARLSGVSGIVAGLGNPAANVSLGDGSVRLMRHLNRFPETVPWLGTLGHRLKRNIACGRWPGAQIARAADRLSTGAIASPDDIAFLRTAILGLQEDFLKEYVPPEDHRYFVF